LLFFFQAEDGIRDDLVTGVQTCALPIFTPEMFLQLANEPTIVAVKESSENPRRLTDLVNLLGDRYLLFCGVDDLVLESVLLGARSEERRVGKGGKSGGSAYCLRKEEGER